MTHTGPMHEADGEFTKIGFEVRPCAGQCAPAHTDHQCATWESNDGAYEDYRYTCTVCGAVHWVDGIDS